MKHKIKIDLDLDDSIYIYNFANEFSQAIINILHNAADAFVFENKINKLRVIKIITKQKNDMVSIEIIDNAGGVEMKL